VLTQRLLRSLAAKLVQTLLADHPYQRLERLDALAKPSQFLGGDLIAR